MSRLSGIDVHVDGATISVQGYLLSVPNVTFVKELVPRGANGLVFEAFDNMLRRRVAVKVWVPLERDRRDRRKQALAEARKVASLSHKNIVQVYSCGEFDKGWIYLTMEFLEGKTLRAALKLDGFEFTDRLRVWREIEDALEYAHGRGVYHGDLHDRNVMLVDGNAKVIDFGTSIFTSPYINPRSRESRLLCELSREVFSGYEPATEEIVDLRIDKLKPEFALSAVSAWVSLLFEWRQVLVDRDDEELVIRDLDNLALRVCQAPVFSVPRLVEKLSQNDLSIEAQNWFVSYCVKWVKVALGKPEWRKRQWVSSVVSGATVDRQANMEFLDANIGSLKSNFTRFGPCL
jgi:serine/threonine protein kinase